MNEKMKNEIKEKTLKALDENDLENVAGGKELSYDARVGLVVAGALLLYAAMVASSLTPLWVDIDRERKEKKERVHQRNLQIEQRVHDGSYNAQKIGQSTDEESITYGNVGKL